MPDTSLFAVFLTGLFAGGLSCMAVQGGLLTATVAQSHYAKASRDKAFTVLPLLIFLIAKLIAYTALGFGLGWIGSLLQLSLLTQIILQTIVVVFMLGTALNMLNVHPIFRYFVIQPPRFIAKLVRKQSKRHDIFAPAVLGVFTVFIPCGTTQAMMALAVASSTPWMGTMILFTFVLATSPIFFLVGYLMAKLTSSLQQSFMKVAAAVIILLAIFNANNVLALSGSPYTLDSIARDAWCIVSYCMPVVAAATPVDTANLIIQENGYSPRTLTVRAGSHVTLHLENRGGKGCTQAFTIPSLGVQKIVPNGRDATVTFDAPSEPGQLSFMCSMGMYRGTINVI